MKQKILDFISKYIEYKIMCENDENIVIRQGLNLIIQSKLLTKDELRKRLSVHIKRILSEHEFDNLLDTHNVDYQLLILERQSL